VLARGALVAAAQLGLTLDQLRADHGVRVPPAEPSTYGSRPPARRAPSPAVAYRTSTGVVSDDDEVEVILRGRPSPEGVVIPGARGRLDATVRTPASAWSARPAPRAAPARSRPAPAGRVDRLYLLEGDRVREYADHGDGLRATGVTHPVGGRR